MIETTFDEYKELLNMTYKEAISHLKSKYGHVRDDYYTEESYKMFMDGGIKQPTRGNHSRTNDGLYVHHICEDTLPLLSTPKFLKQLDAPFIFQRKENLVYCNAFEHAILHAIISHESSQDEEYLTGSGGYNAFLRPELTLWYVVRNVPNVKWKQQCYKASKLSKNEAIELIDLMDEKVGLN